MQFSKNTRGAVLVILSTLSFMTLGLQMAHAPTIGGCQCSLSSIPAYGQEGNPVSLVLTVALSITGTVTTYQFVFSVRDPSGTTVQSQTMNHTTTTNEEQFTIILLYPGPYIKGSNSLLGKYNSTVNELLPSLATNVASTVFTLGLTDNPSYERTQTVNVQGSGYSPSENVGVTIRTQTTSTIVYSATIAASTSGIVTASWKIPLNATIDIYVVTLTGTSTIKTPADTQPFGVRVAIISINSLDFNPPTPGTPTYQRTDPIEISFQPKYPDGSITSAGVGLLTLSSPTGQVTLTATHDTGSNTFNATYQTNATNQTGTWTVSLGAHGYSDTYGNTGPGTQLSNSTQLATAVLSVTVDTNTNVSVGQQLRLNVTVIYPDGNVAQSANVRAYLVYAGTPAINDTIPLVFDSTLGFWVGTHTASPGDTGGLWSLIVTASDSATPPNTGSATRAITIQNNTTPAVPSFPLYYFGILAAIIAAILIGALLVFKKRRVAHASLKIDLDAVHSEAGRIENQEFFQNIKEQVKKDLDDKK